MKIFQYLIVYLLVSLIPACCENKRPAAEGNKEMVKDDLGREVVVPENAERVVSLSPSVTEIIYALGAEDKLVARTPNDHYPPQVFSKPVFNNYPVDFEKLLSYKPDFAIAKEGIIGLEDAGKIEKMGIPVFFQRYDKLEDIYQGIIKTGELLDAEKRASFLADSLRKKVSEIRERNKEKEKKKVLIFISSDPIYVFGKDSYVSGLLDVAGAKNAVDEIFNSPFPNLRAEYLLKINPDIIISGDTALFSKHPALKRTKAFQEKKIFTVEEDLLVRPGPRTVDGILAIEKIVNEK